MKQPFEPKKINSNEENEILAEKSILSDEDGSYLSFKKNNKEGEDRKLFINEEHILKNKSSRYCSHVH